MTVTEPAPVTTQPVARNQKFAHITPNWFAAVMGTGIVATAGATLPVQFSALHVFAVAVWVIAATALFVIGGAFALHWTGHRDQAVAYARHPVMVQFYGAPPMALLTVGAGAGLLGSDLLGPTAATALFAALWIAGTVTGLATSVAVPFRMITSAHREQVTALPAWLMPVVPPMVSASTGALLLSHLPEGQWRLALLCACYAMFGLSLIVGMITLTLIYGRLLHGGLPPVDATPTVWITLGLIGQSITAANLLGTDASSVFTGSQSSIAVGLHVFGIGYGLVMGGFGMLMFALATALTVHAARRNLGFSLTWWSFTFPIGTCVTGATALGHALGHALEFGAIQALAVALYVLLVAAWFTVAARTLRGVRRAELPAPHHR
ncbi:TDT family transporter [Rhodococcus sp. 077-4]|uniref:TDT family transporter n=1 Tax=Rhodococcus sp. 077-4 TaxID=2789271 RepID=UPI0039F5175A